MCLFFYARMEETRFWRVRMNTEEPLSLSMSFTLENAQLHVGHRQRVRDRYLSEGLDAFKDHEVLELLLFYCMPKRDTNPVAHAILQEYGSLSGLFEADPRDIEPVSYTHLTLPTIYSV